LFALAARFLSFSWWLGFLNAIGKAGMATKLKTKNEVFLQEYVKDFNGTQAAIRAGYSEKGADVTASKLLANPKVQSRFKELMAARTVASEISADRILAELACIAFSDPGHVMHWTDAGISFHDSKDLPEAARRSISEVSETITAQGGTKKIKFHNKQAALELLAKIKGLVTEQIEVSAKPLHEEIKRAAKEIGD
jgi:phage terminase small subunit